MLELSRTVRFCLSADPADADAPRDNTFAAWPPMRGLGRYYELTVLCRGEADPRTGYFINIKHIDTAVREALFPTLQAAVANESTAASTPMGALMQDLITRLQPALNHSVAAISLTLTPTLTFTITSQAMTRVSLKQQYEFSAAHRLHVPEFDDAKNRDIFGKCNNPAGHGHNYRFEVSVACPVSPDGQTLEPAQLDAIVNQHVVEALDHKHLNHDVPQFADRNPSVEHIVQVVWEMLADHLPQPIELEHVTVWETGKTSCTYHGPTPVN